MIVVLCWCFELFVFQNPVVKGIPIKQWYMPKVNHTNVNMRLQPIIWWAFFENFGEIGSRTSPMPSIGWCRGCLRWPLERVGLCKDWRKHPTKKGIFSRLFLGTCKELATLVCFFVLAGWVCKDSLLEMRHFVSDTKSPERRQSSQNFRCVISWSSDLINFWLFFPKSVEKVGFDDFGNHQP